MYQLEWRGPFQNEEVNALHAEGFNDPVSDRDWLSQVHQHSLGWVCGRDREGMVGFVNVAWDGGVHAFLLDTVVAARARRQGVGAGLIAVATDSARDAGCAWLHVDFEDDLRPFYIGAGRFERTAAGVIAL
jgi:GNAT superfamily N-acetyltransferase